MSEDFPTLEDVRRMFRAIKATPHGYYDLENQKGDSRFPPGRPSRFYDPFIVHFDERAQTAGAQARLDRRKHRTERADQYDTIAANWREASRVALMRKQRALLEEATCSTPSAPSLPTTISSRKRSPRSSAALSSRPSPGYSHTRGAEPMPKKRMAKAPLRRKPATSEDGGRPTMFPGPKVRPGILITETAFDKAKRDAATMGASISNAVEAAIRAFEPTPARG